ncbi:ABC-2 type transporter [uncultured archaeon]|nr:ABC-2 type transporter [uncultured archaeon]
MTPLLWIFAFGGGLGASVELQGVNYQTFIFPGVVAMAVLFGSIFYGLYIIWDRKLDFLKLVLVAPVPRSAVFLGKMLGGMSDVFIQCLGLMAIGIAFGMVSAGSLALVLPSALLISMCIVSLGLIIGSSMKSPDGFNLVMSFVMWPMFLFSGALFPVNNLPSYLDAIIAINPLTYGVDLLRFAMLGTTTFGPLVDVAVLLAISLGFIIIGTKSFERMQV